jgi:hypothetical protein
LLRDGSVARTLQPRGFMRLLRPTNVAFLLGFAFASLGGKALAQTPQEAGANAPTQPAVPAVEARTPAAMFGATHQLAISSDAGLSISNTSQSGGHGSTTTINLAPAVDYFVMDHFSVGGFLRFDWTHVPDGHSTVFGIGPRVGYDIPFSSIFSVWPKLGLSFATTSQSQNGGSSETSNNLALNIFVPVMLHPAEHFFLGFGPAFDVDLTGKVKSTTIAGRLTIGGYL